MSGARIRRAAIVALVLVAAIAIVLPVVPGAPGTLRAGGVSLLWWYAAAIAPVLVTLIALAALLIRSE